MLILTVAEFGNFFPLRPATVGSAEQELRCTKFYKNSVPLCLGLTEGVGLFKSLEASLLMRGSNPSKGRKHPFQRAEASLPMGGKHP